MDFKEALNTIINKNRCEIFNDIFRVRSILCDYVGFSPYQTKLVYIFCDIYKEYNLIQIFRDKGLIDGRTYLVSIYSKYKNRCTFVDFKEAINPISEIICPEEYKKYNDRKLTGQSKGIKVIKNSKKRDFTKKEKKEEFRGLAIKVKAKSLTIEYGDEFAIYNNSNTRIDINKFETDLGVLQLKLNYVKSNITIKVPKNKSFEILNINAASASVNIKDYINVDNCNIETKSGNIDVVINCENFKFKTTLGNVKFTGDLTNIEGSTTSGTISYFLIPKNKDGMTVRLTSFDGDIYGFFAFRLRKRLTSTFFKTRTLITDVSIYGCLVSLYHQTMFGRIKIK